MKILTAGFLCALCLMLLPSLPVLASELNDTANVVATVNGVPVYERALIEEAARLFKKRRSTGMARDNGALDGHQKMKALDSVIDKELLRQASHAHQVADLDERIAARLKEISGKYKTDEDFAAGLKKAGKSLEVLTDEVREGVIYTEYLRKNQIAGAPVPDARIDQFYRQNARNLLVPEQVKVRHIVIDIEGDSAAAADKAAQKARDIRARIVRDKNFAAVARDASSCSSAPQGGELGYIKKGFMPAEFDQVAFALPVGEMSEPFRTKHGFHIVEVLDKKPESVRPLVEVKEHIVRYLQPFVEEELLRAHVAELRKKASIKIMLKEAASGQ